MGVKTKIIAVETGVSKAGNTWFRVSIKITRSDGKSGLVTHWLNSRVGQKCLSLTADGAEPYVKFDMGFDETFHMAILDVHAEDEFEGVLV